MAPLLSRASEDVEPEAVCCSTETSGEVGVRQAPVEVRDARQRFAGELKESATAGAFTCIYDDPTA